MAIQQRSKPYSAAGPERKKGCTELTMCAQRGTIETSTAKLEGAMAKTVLVVDDKASVRKLVHEYLAEEGFRVVTAARPCSPPATKSPT